MEIINSGGSSFNPASPGPIGGTTPAAGDFTTLSVDTLQFGQSTKDVILQRVAADTLGQYRGTNPQEYQLYNFRNGAADYERVSLRWSGNVLSIQPESAGTGILRAIQFSRGAESFKLDSVGPRITGASANLLVSNSVFVSGGISFGVVTKTANYTATAADRFILVDATAGAITVTLPAAASHTGRQYIIKKIDASANAVTIDGNAAETIDGTATKSLPAQWNSVIISCDGTGWLIEAS